MTDKDAHHRQYVSDPLAAQTIAAQTISAQFQVSEIDAANNLYLTIKVFVVSNDGNTIKETLLAITRDDTEASQGDPGTLENRSFSVTSSAATIEEGDRIVVEVGLGGLPTSNASHDGWMRFGSFGGDLPVNDTETGTTFRPWLEFADTLLFSALVEDVAETIELSEAASPILGLIKAPVETVEMSEAITALINTSTLIKNIAETLQLSEAVSTTLITRLLATPAETVEISEAASAVLAPSPAGDPTLSVDWGNSGDFDGANDDVTADTVAVESLSGRDLPAQLTGRATAGLLTATLRNDDGKYSSFNASSPIAGNILPGRPVRLEVMDADGLTKVTIWQGFLDSLIPDAVSGRAPTVTLRALGPLARVAERKVTIAVKTEILTGTAIDDILDDVGWPATDRSIDAGQTTMNRWWAERVQALFALRQVEDTELGFLAESKDGKIAYEDRHHRLKSPHTVSQATFSDASGAALGYTSIRQEDPLRLLYNSFEAKAQLYTVGALDTLWTLAESGADSPSIGPGASKSFWASYPNPQSPTNAVSVDAWATPAPNTDYKANSSADGTGSDLTADMSLAAERFATAMKITLTNNHATAIARITLLKARGTPVTAEDPVTIAAEDTDSQDKYGKRTWPAPGEFIPSTVEGQDHVDFLLSIYKDPLPIIALTFVASVSDGLLSEALDRAVSDRITIVATGSQTELGINEDFFIESIAHRIQPGLQVTTFECSPASGFGGFWVLGTSKLGSTAKLAY